jgi:Subtilase family
MVYVRPHRRDRRSAATALAAGLPAAQASVSPVRGGPVRAGAVLAHPGPGARHGFRAACPVARPGHARCFALLRPQAAVNRAIASGVRGPARKPKGWSPEAVESAYKLPVARNSHQTVAVSIAFDTPKLARYLAVYRKHYGLPPCTVASGCLRIVNQRGKASPLPRSGELSGWSVEETLDVSMISAACPHCRILVVEANNDLVASLARSENTAARLGASVISNSYGVREGGFTQTMAEDYNHPGHTIVAASGDSGFTAASFPASLASVTAVGGTQLRRTRNARGWSERVWNQPKFPAASGSGCSAYVAKPAWQHDPRCPGRTVADVAALAAEVPIYEQHLGGWITVAGTSVAAPLIAGVYGLAGNAASLKPGEVYQHASKLFDITTGNNALSGTPTASCGNDYLCAAKKDYDAPAGLGSPNGTGAF